METLQLILMVIGALCIVCAVALLLKAHRNYREHLASEEEERADRNLRIKMMSVANMATEGMLHTARMASDRSRTAMELGVDAHKRIDDNRKLMFLIENYYDDRITALEDEVRSKKKAKKC